MMSNVFEQSKIRLADEFKLNELFNHTLPGSERDYSEMKFPHHYYYPRRKFFASLSNESNVKLFHQLIKVMHGSCKASTKYELQNTYESRFTQSHKTDAILIIGDKKLHVNKAVCFDRNLNS